jgi:hypothetical protein
MYWSNCEILLNLPTFPQSCDQNGCCFRWILVINWSVVSAVYLSAAIAATMDSVGAGGGGGAEDRGYILWWLSAGGRFPPSHIFVLRPK